MRRLVADSFEPVRYPFGAVIVREGDVADAFYVLVSGNARVVKRGEGGEEVPLQVLRPGDSFGEIGLLEDTTRIATVRASGEVEALRIDRALFGALVRTSPRLRESFELSVRQRRLWSFFRVYTAFEHLPADGLAALLRGLRPVMVERGAVVLRQGDPAGPMYFVEEGRLRAYRGDGEEARDRAYFRKGDFFDEVSLLRGARRAATVETLTEARLLELPPDVYRELLDANPELRTRIEERVAQYEYKRLARVPLDFAEEILPADVGAREPAAAADAPAAGAPEDVEAFAAAREAPPAPGYRGRRFPQPPRSSSSRSRGPTSAGSRPSSAPSGAASRSPSRSRSSPPRSSSCSRSPASSYSCSRRRSCSATCSRRWPSASTRRRSTS